MTATKEFIKVPQDPAINKLVTRAGSRVLLDAVVVDQRPANPPGFAKVLVIPPKGGTPYDHKHDELLGDPIEQLNRSRNPQNIPADPSRFNEEKMPDFEEVMQVPEIVRLHPQRQSQERLKVARAIEIATIQSGELSELRNTKSGIAYYKDVRWKPALPSLRMDMPAVTEEHTFGSTHLSHTAPAGTREMMRRSRFGSVEAPSQVRDRITVPLGQLTGQVCGTSTTMPVDSSDYDAKVGKKDDGKKWLWIVAIVAAAFVLGRS